MTDLPNWLFQQFGPAAGYTFPLPVLDVDPDADPLVYVRMNRDWLAYVIAACMPLTLLETWRETDGATLALVTQRAHLLIDMLMTLLCDPLCIDGLRLAGNTLQYSPDGGSTWVDIGNAGSAGNPEDPRTSEPLLPHRTGSNIPCLAAANATACLVELHRELSVWYDTLPSVLNFYASIYGGLLNFFKVLAQNFGLVVDIDSLAGDILLHNAALNEAAFTTTIQDELTCILKCAADVDGQWDSTAMADILAAVATESGDMWALIGIYLEDVAGIRGLNNAGTTNSVASHDCSGCDCGWCHTFDFALSDGGWIVRQDFQYGIWIIGQGWTVEAVPPNTWAVGFEHTIDETTLTKIEVEWHFVNADGVDSYAIVLQPGSVSDAHVQPFGNQVHTQTWYPNVAVTNILVANSDNGAGGTPGTYVSRVTIHGEGTDPFGTPNC